MFGLVCGNVQTEEGYMSQDLRGVILRTTVAFCLSCLLESCNPRPLPGLELGLDSWFEGWKAKSSFECLKLHTLQRYAKEL